MALIDDISWEVVSSEGGNPSQTLRFPADLTLTGGEEGSDQWQDQFQDIPNDFDNPVKPDKFSKGTYWMARCGEEVFGMVGIPPSFGFSSSPASASRGSPNGKALDECFLYKVDRIHKRFTLWTLRDYHDHAIRLYEQNGF